MPRKAVEKKNSDVEKKGRVLRGTVVSDKMQDTIVVEVSAFKKIPKYEKYTNRRKRFLVDDKGNTKKVGEIVEIEECRPISRRKHFRVKA